MFKMELFNLEREALKLIRGRKRSEALKLFEKYLQNDSLTVAIRQRALFAQLACYKIVPENFDEVNKLMGSIIVLNPDSLVARKAARVKDVIQGKVGSGKKLKE